MTPLRSPGAVIPTALIAIILLITGQGIGGARGRQDSKEAGSPGPRPAADRSALPLPEALLGHWVTESGTHFFFSKDKAISVYGGTSRTIPFTVEKVDESERKIHIRITPFHSRILTISPDNQELSDVAQVGATTAEKPIKWKYVDDARTPSDDVIESTDDGRTTIDLTTEANVKPPEFVIGDTKTKIYYWTGCPDYEKAPMQRRAYFRTRKDAARAGYRPAKNCP